MSALRFWATWAGAVGFCIAFWALLIIAVLAALGAA